MRTAFFEALLDAAARDPRVMLVVGDLGFRAVEPFVARFPDRFLNVGVAEQNLAGVSAGLALSGHVVFAYSIANFPTIRCLEQVRNDICYHRANVKIVASGGGLAYGSLGMSHHATEDLAVMRAMPEILVEAPGDPFEVRGATAAAAAMHGPCYLRLGRTGEQNVHVTAPPLVLGRALMLRDGDAATLIATGGMLPTAVAVADRLRIDDVRVRVLSMHTVKPLDAEAVLAAARETRAVFSLEDHSITGGLGSAIAEILSELDDRRVLFRRFGLPSGFVTRAGTPQFLLAEQGLSEAALASRILRVLEAVRT